MIRWKVKDLSVFIISAHTIKSVIFILRFYTDNFYFYDFLHICTLYLIRFVIILLSSVFMTVWMFLFLLFRLLKHVRQANLFSYVFPKWHIIKVVSYALLAPIRWRNLFRYSTDAISQNKNKFIDLMLLKCSFIGNYTKII